MINRTQKFSRKIVNRKNTVRLPLDVIKNAFSSTENFKINNIISDIKTSWVDLNKKLRNI